VIEYSLSGAGWAQGTVVLDDRRIALDASYIHDTFTNIVEALLAACEDNQAVNGSTFMNPQLKIYDDDVELMVDVGNLTHGHFSPRNYEVPQAEREEELIERVIAFLEAAFDDQIEFWRSDIAGGWHARGTGEPLGPNPRRYTWSGPLSAASPNRAIETTKA